MSEELIKAIYQAEKQGCMSGYTAKELVDLIHLSKPTFTQEDVERVELAIKEALSSEQLFLQGGNYNLVARAALEAVGRVEE